MYSRADRPLAASENCITPESHPLVYAESSPWLRASAELHSRSLLNQQHLSQFTPGLLEAGAKADPSAPGVWGMGGVLRPGGPPAELSTAVLLQGGLCLAPGVSAHRRLSETSFYWLHHFLIDAEMNHHQQPRSTRSQFWRPEVQNGSHRAGSFRRL